MPVLGEPAGVVMTAAKTERNLEIARRRARGEREIDLAREFGISPGRVQGIVKDARRRNARWQKRIRNPYRWMRQHWHLTEADADLEYVGYIIDEENGAPSPWQR